LKLKDEGDFSQILSVAGISNVFFKNQIISAIVVINSEGEEIEKKYYSEKVRFPYIPGFRAYRELPAMVKCFSELENKPEVVFISGSSLGRLGLASHFSLAAGVPTIGIDDELTGEIEKEDIIINNNIVGRVLKTKEGSNPLYIYPGNLISIKSAAELAKKFVRNPHKLPEPLRLSHKYAKEVMRELYF
jgi:deoxyribonuclease V